MDQQRQPVEDEDPFGRIVYAAVASSVLIAVVLELMSTPALGRDEAVDRILEQGRANAGMVWVWPEQASRFDYDSLDMARAPR